MGTEGSPSDHATALGTLLWAFLCLPHTEVGWQGGAGLGGGRLDSPRRVTPVKDGVLGPGGGREVPGDSYGVGRCTTAGLLLTPSAFVRD